MQLKIVHHLKTHGIHERSAGVFQAGHRHAHGAYKRRHLGPTQISAGTFDEVQGVLLKHLHPVALRVGDADPSRPLGADRFRRWYRGKGADIAQHLVEVGHRNADHVVACIAGGPVSGFQLAARRPELEKFQLEVILRIDQPTAFFPGAGYALHPRSGGWKKQHPASPDQPEHIRVPLPQCRCVQGGEGDLADLFVSCSLHVLLRNQMTSPPVSRQETMLAIAALVNRVPRRSLSLRDSGCTVPAASSIMGATTSSSVQAPGPTARRAINGFSRRPPTRSRASWP